MKRSYLIGVMTGMSMNNLEGLKELESKAHVLNLPKKDGQTNEENAEKIND